MSRKYVLGLSAPAQFRAPVRPPVRTIWTRGRALDLFDSLSFRPQNNPTLVCVVSTPHLGRKILYHCAKKHTVDSGENLTERHRPNELVLIDKKRVPNPRTQNAQIGGGHVGSIEG